jgi:hypothetical protein
MKTHLSDTGSIGIVVRRRERGRDPSLMLKNAQDIVRRLLVSSKEIGPLYTFDDRVGLGFHFRREVVRDSR